MSPPIPLFVYGTLMRGEAAHARLDGARFLGPGRTEPCYTLIQLEGFPGLLEEGRTSVYGELYEVDHALLEALDEYEDAPRLYLRRPLRLEGGVAAQGYVLMRAPAEPGRPLTSGDWRLRSSDQRPGSDVP